MFFDICGILGFVCSATTALLHSIGSCNDGDGYVLSAEQPKDFLRQLKTRLSCRSADPRSGGGSCSTVS
jgi:hypothetical protein